VAAEPASTAFGAPAGHRLLVVDDDDNVRRVAADFLRRQRFEVLTASDCEVAIDLLREHAARIACVVLDLTMPRLDGVAAFAVLRRLRGDVPVILRSGYSEEEAMARFTGSGLAAFLAKPYRLETLHATIQRALRPGA
jgi:two-component system cell cycle sensor histidine kinase/response regulator CckA